MIIEATPILSLFFAKGLGAKTLGQIVDQLVQSDLSPAEMLNLSDTELVERFGLRRSIVDAIHSAEKVAIDTAEELAREGIEILIRGVDPYPSHLCDVLGDNAPPILFVCGNTSILSKHAVGFCGSRKASEKGIRIAGDAAGQLAGHDVNVVSGYAKGVDLAAHVGSLNGNGVTTIVLAEGILHYRAKREVKSFLNDENHLVVSEFPPRLPWAGRSAMQRNKTIIGLSDAVVCVESGMTGGTFAAADSTLKLGLPLFVVEFAAPSDAASGNSHFIERGAMPLRGDRTGKPNLKRVLEVIGLAQEQVSVKPAETIQPIVNDAIQVQDNTIPMPKTKETEKSNQGTPYPKRLIEVDLPIARISAHARREKSIRHGHISTLHIWWARRPLAACRAVICASLWPDPADELCPQAFRDAAVEQIKAFARRVFPKRITDEGRTLSSEKHCSPESRARWEAIANETLTLSASESADMPILRLCLLDFIADFASWDNSTVPAFLDTSRALTQSAHESLGGVPGTRPLVIDPFAGGGSIPLEALRVGADAFGSDLNPIPVLLNKMSLEFIPKYGESLTGELLKWGEWIKCTADKILAPYYPHNEDEAPPVCYLWARTILSEAPGQDGPPVEVPLIRSMWLSQRGKQRLALRWAKEGNRVVCDEVKVAYFDGTRTVRRPRIEFFTPKNANDLPSGTVARGSATCPVTGFTTPVTSVRSQLKNRNGGAADGRIFAVVCKCVSTGSFSFREATEEDYEAVVTSQSELSSHFGEEVGFCSVPSESTPLGGGRGAGRAFSQRNYGIDRFRDLFTPRQLLALMTYSQLIREAGTALEAETGDKGLATAVQSLLAFALNKGADYWNSISGWMPRGTVGHAFHRQAIQIIWDFAEAVPIADFHCAWHEAVGWVAKYTEGTALANLQPGTAEQANATQQLLPSDSAACLFTDPPYYDAVPYADLSDFFVVWLKRSLGDRFNDLLAELSPKDGECIVDDAKGKDDEFFEETMTAALADSRRVVAPNGIGVIVFAHKSTAGWESQLQSMILAGWTVTGSWPIDTERGARLRAMDSAALASSVHLVCRPRESTNGELVEVHGEWRDVLSELPNRIHEWMPRLAAEGVVGADAIFACLGPALEIYSRYSRVEKSNGELATLREYLEFVWGAVSTEALSLIFKDADAAGLEPDARLTAMWLWTIGGGGNGNANTESSDDESKIKASEGFTLEFDAARKIAQGLGVHLEQSATLVVVKGDNATLLPVAARTRHLFGKEATSTSRQKAKTVKQRTLFDELDEVEAEESGWTSIKGPPPGSTTLDRVHQAMILFAANRGELLKRFLVEDGVGKDERFWKLADNLNKLYPTGTEERRWVEGLLARKKGLGL
ncbi:DNA-processing protein DprA [Blastopirellula retiformator]|uniref:Uncharacterized protein n=1 Tax=Blastopirellula retiformator TaxID=2527970 RepID=A0A5C5UXH7_9BACT|nr:DNA-processing protein DprA [Blastopirellula retiformator]TWT30125.1 hypothetical protein Enr8_47840 [Blastopirellula retiformator]